MKHLGLLALVTLVPACPLLDVEVEAPEVCLTYPNLMVTGVGGATSLDQSFTLDDLDSIHQLTELDASVHFVRAQVRARGVADLGFVETTKLTVASDDPDSTLPTLTVYDCEGCESDAAVLDVPARDQGDALAYVKGDSVVIGVAFTGEMPANDWAMDVDVCFSASAHYTLEP